MLTAEIKCKLDWLKCEWMDELMESMEEMKERDDDYAFEWNLEALQALHYLEHLEKWLEKKEGTHHGFAPTMQTTGLARSM